MKNFLAAILCGALLLTSACALASVDGSKIALGSVYPGMSVEELIRVCGQPSYRDGDDWIYANFKVDTEHGHVEEVSTTSGAVSTPDGIHVGQPDSVLNGSFGSADKVDHEDYGVEYEYYSNDRSKKIEFKVANGNIVKITCKLRD